MAAKNGNKNKTPGKQPPSAQKTQVKAAPEKKAQSAKTAVHSKNNKKKKHQQYDVVVTIDLVRWFLIR